MHKIQYTIRSIPPAVDRIIRKRSQQSGKSFNQTVVELLSLQTLGTIQPSDDNTFDWLFATNTLDASFDKAIEDLSKIDKKLWQ